VVLARSRRWPDSTRTAPARRGCFTRAAYLELLGRRDEAEAACRAAEKFPPDEPVSRFFAGMERVRRRDFAAASRDFEVVLDAEPEHFAARLFLAACALHQNKPGEAKGGLTACIAQRPYSARSS
jgi:hypothetical protein